MRAAALDDARREGLRAQRVTLTALHADGVISEPVYEELVTAVDAALQSDNVDEAAVTDGVTGRG